MNIRLPIIFILLFLSQSIKGSEHLMIWVNFTDKDESPYSLSRPHEFLSERALERRLKQSIPLDDYDLPVSPTYLQTLSDQASIEVFYSSRWFNGALLRIDDETILDILHQYPFILSFENVKPLPEEKTEEKLEEVGGMQDLINYDHSQTDFFEFVQNSLFYINQSYPEYGSAFNQVNLVNGQELHKRGYWGHGKVIALLDAGYTAVDTLAAFNYLWNQNRILGYRDFVNPVGNIFSSHPHGTYVLSVMGGYLPGDFAGAALGASYWLLRTEDASSEFRIEEYNWLVGAEFADSVGADIINSSLGYTTFDNPLQDYTYADLDGETTIVAMAANKAFSRGILVVNSAGNYGNRPWGYIGSPADAFGTLSVGGTNNKGERVNFSSFGPSYDGRIKPDIMAQAQGVSVANLIGTTGNANGTSFSSPLIAAMSACLWQKFPDFSNQQLRQAIIQSSDRFLYPDTLYGFGIPNFGLAVEILKGPKVDPRMITLLSNPLTYNSALRIYANHPEVISIDFINSSGNIMWTEQNIEIFPGYNEVRPFGDIESLASGIYIVRVRFNNRAEHVKAIKL
ncbi:MAG: peptidase S8 [Bacteroidetes bacterium]|nr:MAG: peptidase S8 [Bacteroidota bacterium]